MRRRMPDLQLALGTVSTVERSFYQDLVREHGENVVLISDQTYDLISHARLILVASGTATLESAILGASMIKLHFKRINFPIFGFMAHFTIKIKIITMRILRIKINRYSK